MREINSIQILRRLCFDEWGGNESVVWNTTKQLIEQGCPTQIVATSALNRPGMEMREKVKIHRFDYNYPYFPLSEESKMALDHKGGDPISSDLYKFLLNQKSVDLLHCHSRPHLGSHVRRAARQLKIPYVVTFHDRYIQTTQAESEEYNQPLKGSFYYGWPGDLIRKPHRLLQDASGLICVSHNEYLTALQNFPDKEIIYLPNGVDLRKFRYEPRLSFRERYHIPDDKRLVLCVSRMNSQKNQILLIDFMKRLKMRGENAHLVLIGMPTSNAYFRMMKDLVERHQLEEHITIIEGLPSDSPDLICAYRSADCFILPSIHEPFGIVVLEAWAAECPTIASNVGGLKKLINHNHNGLLFDPDNLDDLIEQYDRLAKSKTLGPRLSKNALEHVRTTYTWDKITEHLMDFYDQVLTRFKGNNRF